MGPPLASPTHTDIPAHADPGDESGGTGGERPSGPKRLGRYEILRTVARGGMAEILLARVTGIEGFEKLVVVKRILPELAVNREFVQMFLDEARLAATLHHSNIVQVYDIGEERGQYFFAMEYLHGQDVRRICTRARAMKKPLTLEQSISIVLGACAGLHHAHEQVGPDGSPLGLVHRDVSPHNLFITYDGGVKLVDFGIAKATQRLTQTRTGTLKGKIAYMSPEQCRSHPLDRRSDVFSMAILLWELTTGRRLYTQPSDFEIMKAIAELPALAPSAIHAGYPSELEQIVLKGLRADRDLRYQTVEELQIALEDFVRENKISTSPITLRRMMRTLFAGEIEAWALAQRAGEDFAAHIVQALKSTPGEDLEAELEIIPDATRPIESDPRLTGALNHTDPSISVRDLSQSYVTGAVAPTSGRRNLLIVAALTAVVVVAVGGWQLLGSPARPPPVAIEPAPVTAAPAPGHSMPPPSEAVPRPVEPTPMPTTTPGPTPGATARPPDGTAGAAETKHPKKKKPRRTVKPKRPADLDSVLPP